MTRSSSRNIFCLLAFLGRETDPVCERMRRYILDHQLPEGGWSIYPGGPAEVSASVKAYFALKLVGYSPDDPAMVRARKAILESGGAHACNSFTRFYLALLGQIGYDECPCVPPELVLIPSRLNFSLSAMSAWTRTIVVPLSIMSHFKPVRMIEPERGIGELFLAGQGTRPRGSDGVVLLDELLSGGRSGSQVVGSLGSRGLAAAGNQGGPPLDARALREHRRARCHLPADDLHDHRAPLPGLRPGFAGRALGLAAARRLADRGRRSGPGAALPLAGLGHGHRHDRPGGLPAARR